MSSRVIDDRTYTANTGFTLSAAHLPGDAKGQSKSLVLRRIVFFHRSSFGQ
jgi:hypothetical protein